MKLLNQTFVCIKKHLMRRAATSNWVAQMCLLRARGEESGVIGRACSMQALLDRGW